MMEIIDAINNLELWEALLFGSTIGIILKCVYDYGYCKSRIG